MPYLDVAIAIGGAVFYYNAARHENLSPVGWVLLSIAASAIAMKLGASYVVMALAQAALLPAIAAWRVWREDKRED